MLKVGMAGGIADAVDIAVFEVKPRVNRINSQSSYDFDRRNMTAYGGLIPDAVLL